MYLIGCESGLDLKKLKCSSGFVAYDLAAYSGVPVVSGAPVVSGVDYAVYGQYFGAAFIVSAMLILCGLSVRVLLQLIKW